jgi:hypothetical protein
MFKPLETFVSAPRPLRRNFRYHSALAEDAKGRMVWENLLEVQPSGLLEQQQGVLFSVDM